MANREERNFTKAEMKAFTKKYEIFLEAQKEVEEFVTFLKEQHECEGEGWQIGQAGFFKVEDDPRDPISVSDVPAPAVAVAAAPMSENGKEPVDVKSR